MVIPTRASLWLVALAAVLVLVLAAMPQASAEPLGPPTPASLPPELSAARVAQDEATEKIAAQVRAINDGSGLASIVLDAAKSRVDVYWKNPPSELTRLDGAEIEGLQVHVNSAPYSESELRSAAEALLDSARLRSIPGISTVALARDAGGLSVEVSAETLAKSGPSVLIALYGKVSSLPVTVKVGAAPKPTTRQNDSDPWYGGGMIRDSNTSNFCSVAFAAVTSSDAGRLLSARHCDPSGNVAWRDGHGDPLTLGGSSVSVQGVNDTMLIDPIGGTGPYVHGGPWDATSSNSRYHLKVVASGRAFVGQSACTSGANSGEHCGLIVQDDVVFDCDGVNCYGFRATKDAIGTVATVGGDSGGPVYQQKSGSTVGARGVIYGGVDDVSCGRVRFSVSNCYGIVYFNDITGIERAWNVQVEKG